MREWNRFATCVGMFLVLMLVEARLAVAAQSSTSQDAQFCGEKAREFIHRPSGASVNALEADASGCWSTIAHSDELLQSLIKVVAGGDVVAAAYLAPRIRRLEGGNLEDALTALGEFAEKRMKEFLELVKAGKITTHELNDSLTMLPLTLSDEPSAQLSAMKKRRAQVEQITDPALSDYRAAALKSIDSFIAEIQVSMSSQ